MDWIWMPHAGHFIAGQECRFRLNTYVNGYIVSTVGELVLPGKEKYTEIGLNRLYETMVFNAKPSEHKCCPYVMDDGMEIDFAAYNNPGAAYAGHIEMCKKWDRRNDGTDR